MRIQLKAGYWLAEQRHHVMASFYDDEYVDAQEDDEKVGTDRKVKDDGLDKLYRNFLADGNEEDDEERGRLEKEREEAKKKEMILDI